MAGIQKQGRLQRALHGAIIVSWFGTTDLNSMNAWRISQGLEATPGVAKYADRLDKDFVEGLGRNGPVRALTDEMPAQKIFLLSSGDYEPDAQAVKEWVERGTEAPVEVVLSGIKDPTDYEQILAFLDRFRQERTKPGESSRMVFNLSPGTPAMQACTMLYAPLNFPSCRLFKTLRPDYAKDGQSYVQVKVPYAVPYSLGVTPSVSGGSTAASKTLADSIRLYAPVRSVNILLQGETGVGKTRFAFQFHRGCRQAIGIEEDEDEARKSFVVANCAELARGDGQMFRAELFGARKGSYTGAVSDMQGLFETAAKDRKYGGTLFLDEIGEIPLDMQSVLLRALQERKAQRLGDTATYDISNVRIIAATNRDLHEEMREGRFRVDLYYRIAMCPLRLPSLKEMARKDRKSFDRLLQSVLEGIARREPALKDHTRLSDQALDFCRSYGWPGNVRELEHVLLLACNVARANWRNLVLKADIECYVGPEQELGAAGGLGTDMLPTDLEAWVDAREEDFVKRALEQAGGNASQAARALGLTLSKFNTIRKRFS